MLRHCGPCKGQSLSITGRDEDLRTAKNTFRDENPKVFDPDHDQRLYQFY